MDLDFNSHEEKAAEKFNQLASLNLSDKTESKNGLSYVSWANTWKAFKEVYPTASYKVINNPQTNLPYFIDPALGIMVFTEVSADGLTYSMWLPVMEGGPIKQNSRNICAVLLGSLYLLVDKPVGRGVHTLRLYGGGTG